MYTVTNTHIFGAGNVTVLILHTNHSQYGQILRMVAETHSSSEVKEFAEMRMLLTSAAERGNLGVRPVWHILTLSNIPHTTNEDMLNVRDLAGVCVVLIDEFGCLVDGVRDKRNKKQWHAVQRYSGQCLPPPLLTSSTVTSLTFLICHAKYTLLLISCASYTH